MIKVIEKNITNFTNQDSNKLILLDKDFNERHENTSTVISLYIGILKKYDT